MKHFQEMTTEVYDPIKEYESHPHHFSDDCDDCDEDFNYDHEDGALTGELFD